MKKESWQIFVEFPSSENLIINILFSERILFIMLQLESIGNFEWDCSSEKISYW
jgi:hypothetical protein